MPGHRLIGTTLAVVVTATLAACDGGDPVSPARLQVPEPSLNIYIPGPTSDVTLHILEINHPFKFFFSFTSPFTLRIPACPSGGCDYLYPSPTVTAGGVYPLGMVSGPQILVFRVLGCNPAYGNLCFYGATRGLGGNLYGFAFNPYSGEYDDLVFEVLYEPPEEEDTLVVSLVLARDSVAPVIDRVFNPITQNWSDAGTPQREDTIRFSVVAHWDPSGLPAAGASVEVSIEPVDDSGGHAGVHTPPAGSPVGRPPGRLFDLSEIGSVFGKVYASDHKSLTLVLSADGSAEALYRTSGLGGIERLRASVTAESSTAEAVDSVTILWPGLVEVDRRIAHNDGSYVFEGEANGHYPHENYLAPGVIEHMATIWDAYIKNNETDPVGYPIGRSRFIVTGASLEWGGLFDWRRNWSVPHTLHRIGKDIDFDAPVLELAENRSAMEKHCGKYEFEGVTTKCQVHDGSHFHAFVGSTHYHR